MTIDVTNPARVTLTNMVDQAHAVGRAWHRIDPEAATRTSESLANVLSTLLTSGEDLKVFHDDNLSLLVEGPYTIGVIFHAKHYRVALPDPTDGHGSTLGLKPPRVGRYCAATLPDGRRCMKPYRSKPDRSVPTCDCTDPLPVAMPVPGEWLMHS